MTREGHYFQVASSYKGVYKITPSLFLQQTVSGFTVENIRINCTSA